MAHLTHFAAVRMVFGHFWPRFCLWSPENGRFGHVLISFGPEEMVKQAPQSSLRLPGAVGGPLPVQMDERQLARLHQVLLPSFEKAAVPG